MTIIRRLLEKLDKIEQGLEISETVRYNEDKNSDEFDYDKVVKELKRRQKRKTPVNVRNKKEKATLDTTTAVFTEEELKNGCAIRFTGDYKYSLVVFSDSTYTINYRQRLK